MVFERYITANLLLAWITLTLAGCTHVQNPEDDELQRLYPRGVSRALLLERSRKPVETVMLDGHGAKTQLVAYHLKQIAAASAGTPIRYDVFTIWGGRGTSVLATNLYFDYVYYDASDRCIWVGRKKMD
jgi:hypothetical protein